MSGVDEKTRKLESENSNLTSKIFSLESEIKGLKFSITTKDNEITELKSKSLGNSQRELEFKESVEMRDKELSTLR
jgi:peptidoglycan hydrolase CwlO-like protein